MLEFGYGTRFGRLNIACPSLVYTAVLFHLLGSVTCPVNDFASIVEKLGGLFNAANDCEYSCPEGYQRVKSPGYVPSHNGCGAYGVKISLDQFPSITGCCNKHDTCYDTCGSDKNLCDGKLKKCVKDICDSVKDRSLEEGECISKYMQSNYVTHGVLPDVESNEHRLYIKADRLQLLGRSLGTRYDLEACQSVARVIYAGTAVLGCPAFLDAQKNACLCRPKKRDFTKNGEL